MNVRDTAPNMDIHAIADPRCYDHHCRIEISYDIRELSTRVQHGQDHENPFLIADYVLWGQKNCLAYALQQARDYVKRCHDFEDGTDEQLNELLGAPDLSRFER